MHVFSSIAYRYWLAHLAALSDRATHPELAPILSEGGKPECLSVPHKPADQPQRSAETGAIKVLLHLTSSHVLGDGRWELRS